MTHAFACKIVTLFQGGTSQRGIARTLLISRRTVRRVLEQFEQAGKEGLEHCHTQRKRRRPSKLDRFETAITELLAEHPNITIRRLGDELQRSGYVGSQSTLCHRVRELRPRPEEENRRWMLRVLQCNEHSDKLRPLVRSDEELRIFVDTLRNGKPKAKNRVMAVLAVRRGDLKTCGLPHSAPQSKNRYLILSAL